MQGLIGITFTMIMVFGGYVAAGGKLAIIIHALPYELMIILGAAVGSFILANSKSETIHTLKDIGKSFKGPTYSQSDYLDLLCLLYELLKVSQKSPIELDQHIDSPADSGIFARYPKIMKDEEAISIICDTLRSISMNFDDPLQVEELLNKRIEANHEHAMHSSHSLQSLADGLPALGIVAAVLGVIKTMGSIDQPPEVLGKLIGAALVGTFVGVFLAYGLVGPIASRMKALCRMDSHFYYLIRDVIVANLYQNPAQICIEVGRQNAPSNSRPNHERLSVALKELSAGKK